MKRYYRIFIVWFYGKLWLAKTIKYRIEREQWKKVVIAYMRKNWKPIININPCVLRKDLIHKQIRCGGNPIDIDFMEKMFSQKD